MATPDIDKYLDYKKKIQVKCTGALDMVHDETLLFKFGGNNGSIIGSEVNDNIMENTKMVDNKSFKEWFNYTLQITSRKDLLFPQ